MGKGNKRITFRIPPELDSMLNQTLSKRNDNSPEEPMDVTGFILAAIREKINKMARSRRSGGK